MKKKVIGFVVIVAILLFGISKTSAEEVTPKELKGLDSYINKLMKEWHVPGLSVGVVKDGKLVYKKGYGFRDLEKKSKVTPETIFAIGSNTKSFTATVLGTLVDDKKLKWNKPVRKYMPEFGLKDEYAANHATAVDLLSHRTGLPTHDALIYQTPLTRKQIMKQVPYLKMNDELRESWQYNNLMFMAAGSLAEEISGKSWKDLVQERIFNPLGMDSSNCSVHITQETSDNYALPYQVKAGKVVEKPFADIDAVGPAGSINSNVIDMSKWLMLHINKGKFNDEQIVSETTMDMIHTPHMLATPLAKINPEQPLFSYGLGIATSVYQDVPYLMHSGTIQGFHSLMIIAPQENLGVIVLSNGQTRLPDVIAYNIFERMMNLEHLDWNKKMKNLEEAKEKAEKQAIEELAKKPNSRYKAFS